MKLYEVAETSSRGKGKVKVRITEKPKDDSPSSPIYDNPCEGLQVIRDSVFRSKLSKHTTHTVFTAWVACPPFGLHKEAYATHLVIAL